MRSSPALSLVVLVSAFALAPLATAAPPPSKLADDLLDASGLTRGIVTLVAGEGSDARGLGELAVALAANEGVRVHVWAGSRGAADVARGPVIAAGMHGRVVVVDHGDVSRLPYAESIVDVVLATGATRPSVAETLRVLCPRGRAFGLESDGTLRSVVTKERPAGEGDWTHLEHAPDNNPVSQDALIKAPYMTRWLGRPYYIAMPAITVAANGRIYLATGHIAHHEREEPWLNTLMARNGYNGTVLWNRKLPNGYLVHRSAFVALDDGLAMIDADGSGCLLLDGQTGEEQARIDMPAGRERGQWKWMAVQDGVLLALIGAKKDPSETTVVRSTRPHWSWGELSKGYYPDRIPWGFGERIVAFDLETREVLWKHEEKSPIDSRGMVSGGGRIFYYCPDSHIGSLDLRTGKEVWKNADEKTRELIEEKGRGLTSTPGFRTMTFCLYTPDVLVYQAQTRMNVVALSTRDGYLLWNRQKTTNNPNALSIDGSLVLGIGERGSSLLVEPISGKTVKDLGFAKRSCARLTATSDSLFCRGMPEGLTRLDRQSGKVMYNGAVRPACNDGVVAANGLLYMGPWLCDCNLTLMGRVVMCSAGNFDFSPEPAETRLETVVDGDRARVTPLAVDQRDWPTYRGSAQRTGSTPVRAPEEVMTLWRFRPQRSFTPTAPVAAGGLVFLGGDDGSVRAIDADSGAPAWTHYTAGPILQPPTIADGRAYVGSADGFVSCLEAKTGRVLWRFRLAPRERRIPVYGALSSTWPVHSGVLVENGVAYAAAGIIDYDGTYVAALDAATGVVKWENASSGHLDASLRKGVSAQGILTSAKGRLWLAGGNVVSPAAYDLATGAYRGAMLENGSPRTNRGEEIGVFRDHLLLGGRLRYSATENVVTPGSFTSVAITGDGLRRGRRLLNGKIPPAWNDERVAVVPARGQSPMWFTADAFERFVEDKDARRKGQAPTIARARDLEEADTVALALAPNAVLAVAEHDMARNLRSRWTAGAYDPADGGTIWQRNLPGAALPGGLAVDRLGRVLVALVDGGIVCLGGQSAFTAKMEAEVEAAIGDASRKPAIVERLLNMIRASHAAELHETVGGHLARLGVEPGRAAKERGALTSWSIIGPVPWSDPESPANRRFVNEPDVNLDARVALGNRRLRWRAYRTIDENGKVDVVKIHGSQANVAVYAHAEFHLDAERAARLLVGSNDGFICWFNGEQVGRFDEGRVYSPDQDALPVRARAGKNTVLLKVTQLGNNWAFGVRVTDPSGQPLPIE